MIYGGNFEVFYGYQKTFLRGSFFKGTQMIVSGWINMTDAISQTNEYSLKPQIYCQNTQKLKS